MFLLWPRKSLVATLESSLSQGPTGAIKLGEALEYKPTWLVVSKLEFTWMCGYISKVVSCCFPSICAPNTLLKTIALPACCMGVKYSHNYMSRVNSHSFWLRFFLPIEFVVLLFLSEYSTTLHHPRVREFITCTPPGLNEICFGYVPLTTQRARIPTITYVAPR